MRPSPREVKWLAPVTWSHTAGSTHLSSRKLQGNKIKSILFEAVHQSRVRQHTDKRTQWSLKDTVSRLRSLRVERRTYLVSLSMVCTWTLLWVWERTASCWAHFKQRPPTWLDILAARRDSLCFSRSLRSSQFFWYSARSFLKRRERKF